MDRYDGPLFDCDNHYYEAEDAFLRHVPRKMQRRCVQWVEMDGKRYHLVAGKLNHAVGNPTFNPISKPGVLREYYRGNPEGKTFVELTRSALEPRPPEYMDRDARVARVEGRVILQAVIDGEGLVREIEVLRCNRPHFGFEEAATVAVQHWRYEPAMQNERPVSVYFTIRVDFELL